MDKKVNLRFFINSLFFFCCLLFSIQLFAQEKKVIVIKHSKDYIHTQDGLDRLIGEVVLVHDSTTMICDSVHRYPNQKVQAFGNVHILQRDIDISGDEVDYDGETGTAFIRGKLVTMSKQSLVLRTTLFEYNTKTETGKFHNGGTVADSSMLLESVNGAFYSKEDLFVFNKNVEMKTNNYDIISDSLAYNSKTEFTYFLGKSHIWHERGYLRCDKGIYDKLGDLFDFTKNSYVVTGERELWADTIHYNGKESLGKFYNNVQIIDTLKETIILGNIAEFTTSPEYMMVTKSPSLIYFPEKQDTVYLRADTIQSIAYPNANFKKDTTSNNNKLPSMTDSIKVNNIGIDDNNFADSAQTLKYNDKATIEENTNDDDETEPVILNIRDSVFRDFTALHHVRVFRNDFQAICDTFFFSTRDSIGRMFNNPILWNQGNMQELADYIIFYVKGNTIDKAEFRDNAFVVIEEDSLHYSQVKGRKMWAYFQEQELRKFDVLGNSQAIYYIRDKDSTLFLAEKIAGASEISAFLKERKINKISVRVNVESNSIPVDYGKEVQGKDLEITLKGFAWHKEKRPKTKEDIIGNRAILPSERKVVSSIKKPNFPITKHIDSIKKEP